MASRVVATCSARNDVSSWQGRNRARNRITHRRVHRHIGQEQHVAQRVNVRFAGEVQRDAVWRVVLQAGLQVFWTSGVMRVTSATAQQSRAHTGARTNNLGEQLRDDGPANVELLLAQNAVFLQKVTT
jgi:hypothetical protein